MVKGRRGESAASGETEQQAKGLGGQLVSPNPEVRDTSDFWICKEYTKFG